MNALAQKFAEKGILPRDVELTIAIAKFHNHGGTLDRALELVRAAYEKGPVGYGGRAAAALISVPAVPTESGAKGHAIGVDKTKYLLPEVSGRNDGEDEHPKGANPAGIPLSSSPSPNLIGEQKEVAFDGQLANFSSQTQRKAARLAMRSASLTLLDSFKLRDGRAIGDLAFCEIEGLRAENAREAAVLRQIQKHYANAPGNALVRDLIKLDVLERFIQKGVEVADAG